MRALKPEHWVLLFVLGIAGFFEGYDSFLFTVALPQVRESFGLTQSGASLWLSLLFLGSIPAVFVTRYADIHGRRRLLLASLVGYSVFTAVTALSPSIGVFVYAQFIARMFLNAEYALAWTMVAEELPAGSRGFGFGWLATVSAVGAAISSILYGGLFAPLGVSWRWLYLIALPPLSIVVFLRKGLPETRRYTAAHRAGKLASHWHDILRPPHLRWMVLVGITDLLFAFVTIADVFTIDFMQTDRGLSTTSSNLILFGAGLVAIPVLGIAGSMSDRYGRKLIGCSFAALGVAGALSFFLFAHNAASLFVSLVLMLSGQFGAWPTLDAFYAELFPTELRAFAGSAASIWRVPGEFLSLMIGSSIIAHSGGISPAVAMLSVGPIAAILIIWMSFPETKGRELEDIHSPRPRQRTAARRSQARSPVLTPQLAEPRSVSRRVGLAR